MTDTISIIPTKIPIVSASINPTQSSIERIWVSTSRIAPETAASVLFTLFVIMAAIVTTKIMIAAI